MDLIELVLRRPVNTVLAILCLIVSGLSSVMKSSLEPALDMNMSMIIVMTVYSDVSPDDVSELVTGSIEDRTSTPNGLDIISSQSEEDMSIVMLEYKYGTDVNDVYDDLKKQMGLAKVEPPEDADGPIMLRPNTSLKPNIVMAVSHNEGDDLYNYANNEIAPGLGKLSAAAEVFITDELQKCIRMELMPERLEQYGVPVNSIAGDIAGSDIIYPTGDTQVGGQKLFVSTEQPFEIMGSLNDIPLTVSGGQTVYLSGVAKVCMNADDVEGIARYEAENGLPEDTVALTVGKWQDTAALNVSKDVEQMVNKLTAKDSSLQITVADDDRDSIISSLGSVIETTVLVIITSIVIIWLFFGDLVSCTRLRVHEI